MSDYKIFALPVVMIETRPVDRWISSICESGWSRTLTTGGKKIQKCRRKDKKKIIIINKIQFFVHGGARVIRARNSDCVKSRKLLIL